MSTPFVRPRGDATTVLDTCDRDAQDDSLFPLNTDISWFSRDTGRRTINFTQQVQTFQFKGTAAFGGFLSFEIGNQAAGDLIHMVGIQVRLGHWLDQLTIAKLYGNNYKYNDPETAWTYMNGLGRALIESAEFVANDTTLERLDTVACDVIFKTFPNTNNAFGFGRDGSGFSGQVEMVTPPSTTFDQAPTGMFDPQRPWPTDRGDIFCVIPFFFSRNPTRSAFPLLSCAENSVRVNLQLRPFDEVIRRVSGLRSACSETPLGQTFTFDTNPSTGQVQVPAATDPPPFADFRLLVFSSLLDNDVRQKYIRRPFEVMYRELSPFPFSQPLKYAATMTNASADYVRVQLPLEPNHPVEEIFWVIRRKAQAINNDWLNYSSYTETQITDNPNLIPLEPLIDASIWINGQPLVQQSGAWFRHQLARRHNGGIVPYNFYIYGYSFARSPGTFEPSGSANLSRAQSVRLDLNVRVPPAVTVPSGFDQDIGQTWEVFVYSLGINWLRFENGICGRLFAT